MEGSTVSAIDRLEALLANARQNPDVDQDQLDLAYAAAVSLPALLRVARAAQTHLDARTDATELDLYRALKALDEVKP
jgi:hypothetical protein